ncbi:MAG: hypothetical protein IKX92_05470, partial [Clostridia bacterium]|nr:hypothetical protein [Clostridia bacterium]
MKKKKKTNPIIVILAIAIVMVLITIGVVLMLGYRFKTLPNGAKFIGKSENGQPVAGTIKYQDGNESELDYYARTIRYANGDIYIGDIVNGCRDGTGIMQFSVTGDVYEGEFHTDEITGNGVFKYAQGDVFTGTLLNSKKDGYGVFEYSNGNRYEGTFRDDV